MEINKIYYGNSLAGFPFLPDNSIDCCVTSPPYFNLRNYGVEGQIGLEETPYEYVEKLVKVFREVRRILKNNGTLWINIGDSYVGSGKGGANYPDNALKYKQGTNRGSLGITAIVKSFKDYKPKDLIGIPWMLAFALRADGWYLRQDIIWAKPNPMPESVKDRCTKAHEYIFLLSKSPKYYFDYKSIMEVANSGDRKDTRKKGSHKYSTGCTELNPQTFDPQSTERRVLINGKYMRNKRSVWQVLTKPFRGNHFATFPENLIIDCIKAGSPEGGIVFDPFIGSGTTAIVARKLNRNYIGIDLNKEYINIADIRIYKELGLFK